MEYINSYSYFLMDEIFENVDYKWDFVNGTETDYRNNIQYKIKRSFDKAGNKIKWYERILNKITELNSPKILSLIIPLLLLSNNTTEMILSVTNDIQPNLVSDVENIIGYGSESKPEIIKTDSISDSTKIIFPNLKKALDLKISNDGIKFIKDEERLKLKAYALGDGMITIGYGHAERTSKSKYKVGDSISQKKADKLFKKDLSVAEKGLTRLFKKWEKEGLDVKITQHQYDILVSMAYNMGVGGLRSSDMILLVKRNKLQEAGEKIKETGISKKFKKGHSKRRNKESEIFLSMDQ